MQERYIRNLGPLTEEECLLLRQRRVFLAGCGGLGGYLLEHLLRAGVGAITVCDGDTIVPSNLNRQLLADMESLGRSKTEAACARAALVNPEAAVEARPVFLTADNALGSSPATTWPWTPWTARRPGVSWPAPAARQASPWYTGQSGMVRPGGCDSSG